MVEHEEPNGAPADGEGGPPALDLNPTVVGIGASAGGLKALRTFFANVPENSGLAYVVVVHLSPEHESHLADLLQPHVKMPVRQVTETVPLETDQVYVIPPGANLESIDTHLRLSRLEEHRRERAPIDHFFRTLASTHDGHAVGVILTGTGSDGALGIKEIKAEGGLTVVQDPVESEYDGMPQSAISTGLVDLVLPLADIPAAVLRFARTEPRVRVPEEGTALEADLRLHLQKISAQIRVRTGRDFSRYKPSTVLRRVQRRMQMRHVEELEPYMTLLRQDGEEVRALADDLLITVTNFFRDPEVFEKVQTDVIPHLFEGKGPGESVRVWSVGCATGEEAYTLAILLVEEAARRESPPHVQVFASDLHERSLERAREGFYPGDIEVDVSPERLRRFFHQEDGGYRVRKELRELVVFAPHNLLSDPPFSRLDLIACRNLLIYLQRDVQGDVIDLFHYALRPSGFLLLGTSETVDGSELFRLESKRHCLYRKRNVRVPEPRLPVFPITYAPATGASRHAAHAEAPIAYGVLHQRMVERLGPPSLLVNPDQRVVHLSEQAGRYLVHPGGELTSNVFKLVREELRIELRAALHAAREREHATRSKPVAVQFDGMRRLVVLDVRPSREPGHEGFALVLFDEFAEQPVEAPAAGPALPGADARVEALETELEQARQRLQSITEEYETSQEEMKASHEELQSANEELRSTLEELETSKEELQSMNEELQTVNQENRHKVEELAQLSSDLQNLLAATDIATLFLDRELRILRFTPSVGELFNVRPVDRGRPLSDLTHRLGYPDLGQDAEAVLRRLIPVEREVRDERGHWYLSRVLPYRGVLDRIEGVVVTFVDVTEWKRAEQAMIESEARYRALAELSPDATLVSLEGQFVYANAAAARLLGARDPRDLLGRSPFEFLAEAQHELARERIRRVVEEQRTDPPTEFSWRRLDGQLVEVEVAAGPISWNGHPAAQVVLRDVTERKAAEAAIQESQQQLTQELSAIQRLHRMAVEGVAARSLSEALQEILHAAIDIQTADFGRVELLAADGGRALVAQHGFDPQALEALRRLDTGDRAARSTADGERFAVEDVLADSLGGAYRPVAELAGFRALHSRPLLSRGGGLVGILSTYFRETRSVSEREERLLDLLARQATDLIERFRAEEALHRLNDTLEERITERTAELSRTNERLAREIEERARVEATRKQLLRQLASTEEEERRRLSRELHDQMGQLLTALTLELHALRKATEDNEIATRLAKLEKLAEKIGREARTLALELRPPALDNLGLALALQGHLEEWSERSGVAVDFHSSGVEMQRFPAEVESTLYRVAQEGLTNVVKHAQAHRVSLLLERRRGYLCLILEDDGVGFDVREALGEPGARHALGLRGMKERLALLGGTLEVESSPSGGTTLFARVAVPWPPETGGGEDAEQPEAPQEPGAAEARTE